MQKVRLYRSKKILAVFVVLSFVWAAWIFSMSNEPATVSADRSGGISDVITPLFFKGFETLSQNDKEAALSLVDHVVRKIAHFCIYAVLGTLISFSFFYKEQTWIWHICIPLLCGALYAASDEIHQAFVPGRGPLVADVFLDSFGVLCGILFTAIVTLIATKKSRK
ncbi:MAG: VanZ family protein [Clostridia bacterium]|nr:VanZ family protein [Clostridia bacterium]